MKSIENAKKKTNRRYGANLWGDPKSPLNKREYAPGQHGQRRKKMTDYGEQLYAKQKLKTYYGNVNENQFHIMSKPSEEAVTLLKTWSAFWNPVWTTWFTKPNSFRRFLLPVSLLTTDMLPLTAKK